MHGILHLPALSRWTVAVPITFKSKKKVSSNKEETLKTGSPSTPAPGSASAVSKLFIDRLSIVLNLDDKQVGHDAYGELMSDQGNKELLIDTGAGAKWGTFKWAKRIVIPSLVDQKKFPLLQCQFNKTEKTVERLRLDFVPVDLGAAGMDDLVLSFKDWFDAGWSIIKKGTVTRLDIAVDMPAGAMGQFHLLPHQGATTRVWSVDGELQTFTHGKGNGNQSELYDRKAKRIAHKKPSAGKEGVRFERRLRKQQLAVHELAALSNPLGSLKLVDLPIEPPPVLKHGQEYIWLVFCRAVETCGLPAALALLPAHIRTAYRKHIDTATVPWWDSEVIWSDWPSAVAELKF